jgi:hypothetical protein
MMFVIGNDVGRPVGQTEDWPRGGGIVLVMSIASLTPPRGIPPPRVCR